MQDTVSMVTPCVHSNVKDRQLADPMVTPFYIFYILQTADEIHPRGNKNCTWSQHPSSPHSSLHRLSLATLHFLDTLSWHHRIHGYHAYPNPDNVTIPFPVSKATPKAQQLNNPSTPNHKHPSCVTLYKGQRVKRFTPTLSPWRRACTLPPLSTDIICTASRSPSDCCRPRGQVQGRAAAGCRAPAEQCQGRVGTSGWWRRLPWQCQASCR